MSIMLAGLVVASLAAVWVGAEELRAYAGYNPSSTLTTAVLLGWLFLWSHEICHGLVLAHLGGRVRAIGVALFYFRPSMFCDANDAWRLRTSRQRGYVASAGIVFHFVIAALLLGVSAVLATLSAAPTAVQICMNLVTFNISTGLFNLLPFVKMDGYWILSSWLDRPRLRQESIAAWKSEARRGLGIISRSDQTASESGGRGSVLFGMVSSLFGPILMGLSMFWIVALLGRAGIIGPVAAIALEFVMATYFGLLVYRAGDWCRSVRIVSIGHMAVSVSLLSIAVASFALAEAGSALWRLAVAIVVQPWVVL